MLIAPAAYHRIAAGGNAEEGVLRYAIGMMLPGEGLLALGIVGDSYVTVRKITENQSLALGTSVAAAFGFVVAAALFASDLTLRQYAGHSLFPMAAPAGGTLLIASWLVLAMAAIWLRTGHP